MRPNSAYVLVYIRDSDWDRIMCTGGFEDLPGAPTGLKSFSNSTVCLFPAASTAVITSFPDYLFMVLHAVNVIAVRQHQRLIFDSPDCLTGCIAARRAAAPAL